METYQEYRKGLITLVNAIDRENGLEEENKVLLLYLLNSVEKISKFGRWIGSKMVDGHLQATETEICRAAVQASKACTEDGKFDAQ
jgi:hypothetical protein